MKKSLVFAAALSFFTLSGCGFNTPSNGEKIGQIVRVNKEGILNKTWEGQLIRGGFTDGSGTVGTVPFEFTIEDETLANKVQEYMKNQIEVIVEYRTEGVYSLSRSGSNGNFLTNIKPAK